MENFNTKLSTFSTMLEAAQLARLTAQGLSCQANIDQCKVTIKPGKKFTKVDVGTSGKFMVENSTGNIYGIKGYGVIHKGHFYGTLETTGEYTWGGYYPSKKNVDESFARGRGSCPALQFATESERAKYYNQPLPEGQQPVTPDTIKTFLSQAVTVGDLMKM